MLDIPANLPWHEIMQLMRDQDWRSVKTKDGWDHLCPACLEELEEDN